MERLQEYVPKVSETTTIHDPVSNTDVEIFIDKFHYILFGGDQLTVERAIGSQRQRSNECRGMDRLEGLCPVIEDWHAKVSLLQVNIIKYLI